MSTEIILVSKGLMVKELHINEKKQSTYIYENLLIKNCNTELHHDISRGSAHEKNTSTILTKMAEAALLCRTNTLCLLICKRKEIQTKPKTVFVTSKNIFLYIKQSSLKQFMIVSKQKLEKLDIFATQFNYGNIQPTFVRCATFGWALF